MGWWGRTFLLVSVLQLDNDTSIGSQITLRHTIPEPQAQACRLRLPTVPHSLQPSHMWPRMRKPLNSSPRRPERWSNQGLLMWLGTPSTSVCSLYPYPSPHAPSYTWNGRTANEQWAGEIIFSTLLVQACLAINIRGSDILSSCMVEESWAYKILPILHWA